MRSDEELMAKLSVRLTEEIRNLPDDGKDHELVIKIKGDHGNINLGTQNFEINSAKQLPPPGSDRERECPQCGQPAWRYTQLCMHCDYDMHRHDQIVAEEENQQRKIENNNRLLKAFGVFVAIATCSFLIKDHLPASLQHWSIGVTAVAGIFAFLTLQAHR
ncbi:hypothetical protein [Pseudomonas sp. zfem002]|uniref:hypothetical protein n=1 Tax=Pseudomonas sp. zfem002 TaxID=3078197 RepID=UPI0029281FC3|nr:hypothetical protein [Pseudomonas sp. zfem002]MDU9392127.1 hypothetical protein [Pseudomonas sp. zfem002]